jgi:plastocyanin
MEGHMTDSRLGKHAQLSLRVAALFSLGIAMMAYAQAPAVTVEVRDTPAGYRPKAVKVKAGQTVKWINKGDTVHTVTSDAPEAPDPSFASVPPDVEAFDSGDLNPGDSWSHAFKAPGVYKYFCLRHGNEGMTGEVDVEK